MSSAHYSMKDLKTLLEFAEMVGHQPETFFERGEVFIKFDFTTDEKNPECYLVCEHPYWGPDILCFSYRYTFFDGRKEVVETVENRFKDKSYKEIAAIIRERIEDAAKERGKFT